MIRWIKVGQNFYSENSVNKKKKDNYFNQNFFSYHSNNVILYFVSLEKKIQREINNYKMRVVILQRLSGLKNLRKGNQLNTKWKRFKFNHVDYMNFFYKRTEEPIIIKT